MKAAGYTFEVCHPEVDELEDCPDGARALVRHNSDRKAFSLVDRYPDSTIIAADTVVTLDRAILGKPRDLDHAREMLAALSGRIHEVITGVTLLHSSSRRMCQFEEVTRVQFRALSTTEIGAYLTAVPVLDKAGAYAAQDDQGRLIEKLEGSFSNVVGLPMERLDQALRQHFI